MRRKRGRPQIGRKKTYTVSDLDQEMFLLFCREKGVKGSELIRNWIIRFNSENLAQKLEKELKVNEEIQNI